MRGKVRNAIAFYKKYGTWENILGKAQKTSLQDDRRIAKLRKADPCLTSTEIRGLNAADHVSSDHNMTSNASNALQKKKTIGVRQEFKKYLLIRHKAF